ncbi:DUF4153 domain-containing protein [uncultured Eubacterium sp.]|uniref:DUF4153 domain-containing protein n=1 Tax=uncultured Eubacterium sp. TaxID=165185 RepID=UPI0025D59310|nr:DUF4173 domain-containing protein [uncultured Eubacterium sp.]
MTEKQYSPLDKKDKMLIFSVAVLCFVFVDFVLFAKAIGLGFTLAYVLSFTFSTVYLLGKNQKPSLIGIVYGILGVASSIPVTLYNDSITQFLMPILALGLYVLYCVSYTVEKQKFGSYKIMTASFKALTCGVFKAMPDVVGSVKAGEKKDKKSLSALVGVLLAIPVLCAVVPLLVKSDAAFEGLVSGVVSKFASYMGELVVTLILIPLCYSYLFSLRHKNTASEKGKLKKRKKLPYTVCTSFLCVISATYLLYLFSQLAYFFSAFSYILPEDYKNTASEFARRGFYEMCTVCAINLAIIGIIFAFVKGKNGKLLKALCTFVSVFSALLVIVAMQKMVMNVSVYGLSKNRILVFAFMLMMLVVIVMLIVHIFAPKVPYMQTIIVFCSALLIAISYSNVDARIADYNIKAYNNHTLENLDVGNIADLSDSAVPYLISLAKSGNADAQEELYRVVGNNYHDELVLNLKTIEIKSSGDIRRFNYSHTLAANAIYDYYLSFDENGAKIFANHSAIADYDKYYYVDEEDTYYKMSDDSDSETAYKLNKATGLYEVSK